ncbi:MAG: hypothetical protein ACRD3B_13470 [Candidatus Sulfotelmatobacter sp.]
METADIFAAFSGTKCQAPGCGGSKHSMNAFCKFCYAELPQKLRNALWQRYGDGFEQAYVASLSWFRTHPLQGVHRAKQESLFKEST